MGTVGLKPGLVPVIIKGWLGTGTIQVGPFAPVINIKRGKGILVRPNPTDVFEIKPGPAVPIFTDVNPAQVLVIYPCDRALPKDPKPAFKPIHMKVRCVLDNGRARVERQTVGLERIATAIHFLLVGEPIPVAVGISGVRTKFSLFIVAQAIPIEILHNICHAYRDRLLIIKGSIGSAHRYLIGIVRTLISRMFEVRNRIEDQPTTRGIDRELCLIRATTDRISQSVSVRIRCINVGHVGLILQNIKRNAGVPIKAGDDGRMIQCTHRHRKGIAHRLTVGSGRHRDYGRPVRIGLIIQS